MGDSLTDGRGSTTDGNDRWPDVLAGRLAANAATAQVALLNFGMGGNSLLTSGDTPAGKERFDHDILEAPNVRCAILFIGVNDINGGANADALIAAYQEMIGKAHAKQVKVYRATITPLGNNPQAQNEATRTTVNAWIRAAGNCDKTLDFDAVVRDASAPAKLNAAYGFEGDGLHMNPTGYKAIADSIDLSLFE